MVFDAPLLKQNFKNRLNAIKEVLDKLGSKHVLLHEHTVCEGKKHLQDELERVQALGGEGMMIKDPKCKYERKRSEKLLKVKTFMDAEAVVTGHENGSGRCENMLGALHVKDIKSG
jgi:DNA ligase 1